MDSRLSIVVVFFFSYFFLLHDKKATKLVVLRRNFKVSKIDVARWSIDLVLPLRLFVYIGPIPKRGRKKRDMRDERKYLNDPVAPSANTVVPCPTVTSRSNLKDVKPLKVAQQHCPARPAPSAIGRDALAFYYKTVD